MLNSKKYFNRDISWLSFNYRVLEEAKDEKLQIYERIKFLAIYSSNLDEFYKVRVASLRSLAEMDENQKEKLKKTPDELLHKITQIVQVQQKEFGEIFYNKIIPELRRNDICLIQDFNDLNREHEDFIKKYFSENIVPFLQPVLLVKQQILPFLQDNAIYLAVVLHRKNGNIENKKNKYAILKIPTDHLPRFVELPKNSSMHNIMFIDDIIKMNLNQVFPGYDVQESYCIKLSRSAELPIEDEFSGNLVEKIRESLSKRKTGTPCRFLFDDRIPPKFLNLLRKTFNIAKNDLVSGGKYHNFSDFFGFPNPKAPALLNEPFTPLRVEVLEQDSVFKVIENQDVAIHPPYQTYDYVLKFFNEAALDPDVESIKLTQYRVAKNSAIVNSMINAARNGKKVTVFVEVKARFDEAMNFKCADEMKKAGVKIIYSMPGLKVHAKIALITKKIGEEKKAYAFVSTGNFNEKTSQLYADHCLFTTNKELIEDIENVFRFFKNQNKDLKFNKLLVGQFNMRKEFLKKIHREIELAEQGKEAYMILKMNGLEEKRIIKKLYDASRKGVKIKLIVRGICCLIPDMEFSKNITVHRIVDRYLEHARVYYFHNNGDDEMYIASADWMNRNLKRRIETAIPVLDQNIKVELLHFLNLQLADNTSARIIDSEGNNEIIANENKQIRSQNDIYSYLKERK